MVASDLGDLRVLQAAKKMADEVWQIATSWPPFVRDTVGKQLVRAVDSIGANVAQQPNAFARSMKAQRTGFSEPHTPALHEASADYTVDNREEEIVASHIVAWLADPNPYTPCPEQSSPFSNLQSPISNL